MEGRYMFLDGNRYAQVFAKESFFDDTYPMEKKSLTGQGMTKFIGDFGGMDRLVCDRSKEQTSKGMDFMKEVRKHGIDLHVTKPYRHNQPEFDGVIREIHNKWDQVMLIKKVPRRLWDYGLKWVAEIMQRTVSLSG